MNKKKVSKARSKAFLRDPKLKQICCIPLRKLEESWGTGSHFLVRRCNGEYFKSDYDKWKIEELAKLGIQQMISKDYDHNVIALEIVEEIVKGIFKRELHNILNGSGGSWNLELSTSSGMNESFQSNYSTTTQRNYDIKNLQINANFDYTNLSRSRRRKNVSYKDSDEEKLLPVKKVRAPRKSRKKDVSYQPPAYVHVHGEGIPSSYIPEPQLIPKEKSKVHEKHIPSNYIPEPQLIPRAKSKARGRKPKNVVPVPVYNEEVEMKYVQTVDAVARYNEICNEILQEDTEPEMYHQEEEVLPEVLPEMFDVFPEQNVQSLPSLPNLTDGLELDQFIRENNIKIISPETPADMPYGVPVAYFNLESFSGDSYNVQAIDPTTISIQLLKIQEVSTKENVGHKRKADDELHSKETKRKKSVSRSTQTTPSVNSVERYVNQAHCVNTMQERSGGNVFNLNFFAPISTSDVEMLRGFINETKTNVQASDQPMPKSTEPNESTSTSSTTTISTSEKISESVKDNIQIITTDMIKPARITAIRRKSRMSITETITTRTNESELKASSSKEKIHDKKSLPFKISVNSITKKNPLRNPVTPVNASLNKTVKTPFRKITCFPGTLSINTHVPRKTLKKTPIPTKLPLKTPVKVPPKKSPIKDPLSTPVHSLLSTPVKVPFKAPMRSPIKVPVDSPEKIEPMNTPKPLETTEAQISSMLNTPKKEPFKIPATEILKEKLEGTEFKINDLDDEFNLSFLSSENGFDNAELDSNVGALFDELSVYVDNKDNEEVLNGENKENTVYSEVVDDSAPSLPALEGSLFSSSETVQAPPSPKKKEKLDSLSDLELDYEEDDIIALDTDDSIDGLSDSDETPKPVSVTPTKSSVSSQNEIKTKTEKPTTITTKTTCDYVSPDVFANASPQSIRNIPRIPKKVTLIEITKEFKPIIFNSNVSNAPLQKMSLNDPRNKEASRIELDPKSQQIMNNVKEEMAERARKREEAEKLKNNVLVPPVPPTPNPIPPPTPPPTHLSNQIFDKICYGYYKGKCVLKQCRFNHFLPNNNQIVERLELLNKADFCGVYNSCVKMPILLKTCYGFFIEVAVHHKWKQFLNHMVEMTSAYPFDEINNIWTAINIGFGKCNLTKKAAILDIFNSSKHFRNLPQIELLIYLMAECDLFSFLKEIEELLKLFEDYQASSFVVERFYETALEKQEPELLKFAYKIATNMKPVEAANVNQDLIKTFAKKYFSIFPPIQA